MISLSVDELIALLSQHQGKTVMVSTNGMLVHEITNVEKEDNESNLIYINAVR